MLLANSGLPSNIGCLWKILVEGFSFTILSSRCTGDHPQRNEPNLA
jgi:hypothetical protein